MTEEKVEPEAKPKHQSRTFRLPEASTAAQPTPLDEVAGSSDPRMPTGIGELDRVLGGGLVPGMLVLVGGDPGIGKSTLLLQALDKMARRPSHPPSQGRARGHARVLYVTGEESPQQVKIRAHRLGVDGKRLLLLAETRTDRIVEAVESLEPAALVIDSIQSVYDPQLESAPGSVSQLREVAARLMYLAKARSIPTLLVGHVTKEGGLAGPKVLEHLVDTVLYFESATGQPYRILRAHKNRFGSTNEIGVFEMDAQGLQPVANPSEIFLAERPEDAPGSVVLPAIEGTRPVLVEVQALVSPTAFGTPRRTCLGFDTARAALLVAVLERRAGLQLLGCDIFINVAGGIHLREPAADLAVAVALASSLTNQALSARALVFGEVGLAGELRGVTQPEVRLAEASKLGFRRAIVPTACLTKTKIPDDMEAVGVRNLTEALEQSLS